MRNVRTKAPFLKSNQNCWPTCFQGWRVRHPGQTFGRRWTLWVTGMVKASYDLTALHFGCWLTMIDDITTHVEPINHTNSTSRQTKRKKARNKTSLSKSTLKAAEVLERRSTGPGPWWSSLKPKESASEKVNWVWVYLRSWVMFISCLWAQAWPDWWWRGLFRSRATPESVKYHGRGMSGQTHQIEFESKLHHKTFYPFRSFLEMQTKDLYYRAYRHRDLTTIPITYLRLSLSLAPASLNRLIFNSPSCMTSKLRWHKL